MLTLVWRASALDDLDTIISYIAEGNVSAAERLQDAIEGCAERLPATHFFIDRVGCPGRARLWSIPIILVYRVTAEVVEVVNLVHARQEYP